MSWLAELLSWRFIPYGKARSSQQHPSLDGNFYRGLAGFTRHKRSVCSSSPSTKVYLRRPLLHFSYLRGFHPFRIAPMATYSVKVAVDSAWIAQFNKNGMKLCFASCVESGSSSNFNIVAYADCSFPISFLGILTDKVSSGCRYRYHRMEGGISDRC